jgi:hypothetical protein
MAYKDQDEITFRGLMIIALLQVIIAFGVAGLWGYHKNIKDQRRDGGRPHVAR